MNREEAILMLQSCRPGGRDAADPQFAAALELAKRDPELAAWFAEEQKFDTLISGGLQQVRVPLDLKAKILAAGKPSVLPAGSPVSFWWQNLFSGQPPVAWAMAAAIVILMSVAIFWRPPQSPARFADFSTRMVDAAVNDANHVDLESRDMKQTVAWLADHQGENKFVLPVALNGDGLMGCRVLDWHGRKISMLCYGLKDSGHVDLFVAESKIFADAPPLDRPQFVSSAGMPTASWSHAGRAYLMVGHGDLTDLEKILSPKTAGKTPFFATASGFWKIFLE